MRDRRTVLANLAGVAVALGAPRGQAQTPGVPTPGGSPSAGLDLRRAQQDYAVGGLSMGPFRLKVGNASWPVMQRVALPFLGQYGKQITWWRVDPAPTTRRGADVFEWLPLGDALTSDGSAADSTAVLRLAKDPQYPDALAHPVGFTWVEDDYDSHGSAHHSYMDLVPPPGYVALGQVWQWNDQPLQASDLKRYWCVRRDYVRRIGGWTTLWNDSGTGWSHNGDVRTPTFTGDDQHIPGDKMLVLPLTAVGAESGMAPFALLTDQAQVAGFQRAAFADPPFDASSYEGSIYPPAPGGVTHVVMMPCTAFSDPGLVNQVTQSPYYFVVNRRIWRCKRTLSTPAGGSEQFSLTIGVKTSDSTEFNHTTSSTISAEGGFDIKGISAKVSTSFTDSFSLTTSHSEEQSTEHSQTLTLPLPAQPVTQFWQSYSEISIVRSDGSVLARTMYGLADYRMLPIHA